MLNAILEEAGHTTAVLDSIRIKIGKDSKPNEMRMSMPGRFYIQRFLSRALRAQCSAAIIEMTSEGARQYRHRGLALDALIFTNLAPEHIEAHGSYEKYADAKFELGKQLVRSSKRPRIIVANAEDAQSSRYLSLPVEEKISYSLKGTSHVSNEAGGRFTFDGIDIAVSLPGDFSLQNALAASTLARALGVKTETIARALEKMSDIPGRAQHIEVGQDFTVIVDYAHTPDSLRALYDAYANSRKICVLGATGGGRDAWKRPVMGKIAEEYCAEVILTDEDPYDESPTDIASALASGMSKHPTIIMDRREAISRALSMATTLRQARDASNQDNIAVLITGKGTDPCICGPKGTKIPWSDAQVAREEMQKILNSNL
jgi:UDP-N-acetylmuramoyl-L-alanyl-D-glutamate--2,6-diaminopimelate ligase